MNYKPEITIVIVSLKSGEIIKECLKNIGSNYQVIIVENSNKEDIKIDIEKNFLNAKCIILRKNYGYGIAANAGIECVKTKYAFLLNADVEIYDYQIKEIESEVKKLNNNFSLVSPFYDDFKDFMENNKFDKFSNLNKKINLEKNIEEVNLIKGSSMLFNLSRFKGKIFDENFFIFFEEIDVCKKLIIKNEKIYLMNRIKIKHAGNKGIENINHNEMDNIRNWHYYWSSFYYHKKHYSFVKSFMVHLTKLIKFFILKNLYKLIKNKKADTFKFRFNGLFHSILGKKSSDGPVPGGR